ncbi:MAG: hypothetical protein WCK55_17715 [Verrucomicrobiota bacterium]
MKTPRFPSHEWAFDRIDAGERAAAWNWELHREAGSKGIPWLKLSKAQRREVCDYFAQGFTIQETDLAAGALALKVCEGTGEGVHVLRINWQVGVGKVKAALEAWAEKAAPDQSRVGTHAPKKGRQDQARAWLEDLAIFRAYKRGMKGSAIRGLLARLFGKRSTDSKTSDQHLRKACRDTAERIETLPHPFRITDVFPSMRLR